MSELVPRTSLLEYTGRKIPFAGGESPELGSPETITFSDDKKILPLKGPIREKISLMLINARVNNQTITQEQLLESLSELPQFTYLSDKQRAIKLNGNLSWMRKKWEPEWLIRDVSGRGKGVKGIYRLMHQTEQLTEEKPPIQAKDGAPKERRLKINTPRRSAKKPDGNRRGSRPVTLFHRPRPPESERDRELRQAKKESEHEKEGRRQKQDRIYNFTLSLLSHIRADTLNTFKINPKDENDKELLVHGLINLVRSLWGMQPELATGQIVKKIVIICKEIAGMGLNPDTISNLVCQQFQISLPDKPDSVIAA